MNNATRVFVSVSVLLLLGPGCSDKKKKIEQKQRVELEGTVVITSEPAGAVVFEKQFTRLGTTPLTLRRTEGTRLNLELAKEGYTRNVFMVIVEGGKQKRVNRPLQAASGELVVTTGPLRGARIDLNGKRAGRTPQRLEVEAGREHLVEVSKPGFHAYRERVSVEPGRTAMVNAMLLPASLKQKPMGWLSLESDVPALVYIASDLLGTTPLLKLPLPAKAYKLRLEAKALGLTKQISLTVVAGEVRKERVTLKNH